MRLIKNNKFSKILRNIFKFKPVITVIDTNKKNISTSDAFFWRTDNNFKTIFKYTDIFNLFFKDQMSNVEIFFYDKNNKFLKKIKDSDIKLSNKIIIDKKFMDNMEDYGTFYIFHDSQNKNKSIIRNSCYTGYSLNDNYASFVHGNTITAMKNLETKKLEFGIGGKTFVNKNTYQIQNSFQNTNVELMMMNPTKHILEIHINNEKFYLNSCCTTIKKFSNIDLIKIKSKSCLLRPIIFNYKNDYYDVYHG